MMLNKNSSNTIKKMPNYLVMFIIFISVDITLFLIFGVFLLNGMEFTSLDILTEMPTLQKVYFHWKYYLRYCTLWCILEDIVITIIYAYYTNKILGIGKSITGIKYESTNLFIKTDVIYMWVAHSCIKILLNLHTTAMFLSVLEYTRESNWTTFQLQDTDLFIPKDCFDLIDYSLILVLGAIISTFFMLINYTNWKRNWNYITIPLMLDALLLLFTSKFTNLGLGKVLIVCVIMVGVTAFITYFIQSKVSSKEHTEKSATKKKNLHRIVSVYSTLFIAISIGWCVIQYISGVDNKNTLFGMQYSAIIKFLTPIFLIVNNILEKNEQHNPDKYIQSPNNLYKYNTLTLIFFSCLVLVILGEFGSIVCILGLTIVMSLLFMDFLNFEGKSFWYTIKYILKSGLVGLVLGLSLIFGENFLLQKILNTNGLHLQDYNSPILYILGIISIAILIIIGIGAFILLFSSGSFTTWIYKVLECLKYPKYAILNVFAKLTNKLNNQHFASKHRNVEVISENISVCIVLIFIVGLVLGYNFAFSDYSGNTILKAYYMTAGNFSNEFEITPNITDTRTTEAKYIIKDGFYCENPNEVSEDLKQQLQNKLENTNSDNQIIDYIDNNSTNILTRSNILYTPEVYQGTSLRIMKIVDRLCFSSKTTELSTIQRALRENMGFNIDKSYRTYISTLQTKRYLTSNYFSSPLDDGYSTYYNADGSLKDTFSYKKDIYGNDTNVIVYKVPTQHDYTIVYDDKTSEVVTLQLDEEGKIFVSAEPTTACSDYVLYTLSKLGVGNVLLLIFVPYFCLIILLFVTNSNVTLLNYSYSNYMHYAIHGLGLLYAISFVIQTIVIVLGVFGVSLFSGLSLPLVAKGNFEMFVNGLCVAIMLIALGDSNDTVKEGV